MRELGIDPESARSEQPSAAAQALRDQLQPWHKAVQNPGQAQEIVLRRLLGDFAQTTYGANHGAAKVAEVGASGDTRDLIAEYRRAFPLMTYDDYKPLIARVMEGDTALLLSEEPVGWAITRGTTKGESKFIPMTPTDLQHAGERRPGHAGIRGRRRPARPVRRRQPQPEFPLRGWDSQSRRAGARVRLQLRASTPGTCRDLHPHPLGAHPGRDRCPGRRQLAADWDNRFELAYEKCKDQNVTLVGGVCPDRAALRPLSPPACTRSIPKNCGRPRS